MKWKIEDFDKEDGVLISLINSFPNIEFLSLCQKLLNNVSFGWNVYSVSFTVDEERNEVVSAYLNVGENSEVSIMQKSKMVHYLKAACEVYLSRHPQDSMLLKRVFEKSGYFLY